MRRCSITPTLNACLALGCRLIRSPRRAVSTIAVGWHSPTWTPPARSTDTTTGSLLPIQSPLVRGAGKEAAANLETLPKYVSPKGCGCVKPFHSPLHVREQTYPIRLKRSKYPIVLTEGEIKTLVSSIHELATGCKTITIGLGGVSAWSDQRSDRDEHGDRQLIPELLNDIDWEHRDVFTLPSTPT